MTTMDQLCDNLKTYEAAAPLSEEEKELLWKALATTMDMVPCTACRYCCDGCPQDLDIPKLIALYNESNNGSNAVANSIASIPEDKLPSACIGCGSCMQLCPQNIEIPDVLKKFAEKLA